MDTFPVDAHAIAARLADRKLVLLGEATHGTHEFSAMRAAISRELIARHGFTAIAVEGDWPDAQRVNRFIHRTAEGDPLADFRRFPTWMWRNEEVLELVTWLRAHAPTTGFYGLDLYSLHASIAKVLEHLERVDPQAAQRARRRYACFDHLDPQQYGMRAAMGIDQVCEDEVVAQLLELQAMSLKDDEHFAAIQNAHVIRDAEAYYRAMFGGRTASWNLRDTHMADTLDLLAQRGKVIVWAHNSHVGDARATEMGWTGELTLGQLARMRHHSIALVGFTTHEGTVACAPDWDEPVHIERVRPSLAGSWEALFHERGGDFGVVCATLPERARLHRAIGVVYRPETERHSHYYDAKMRDQFDLVLHIDRTRAVTPLDRRGFGTATDELPETFPSGV